MKFCNYYEFDSIAVGTTGDRSWSGTLTNGLTDDGNDIYINWSTTGNEESDVLEYTGDNLLAEVPSGSSYSNLQVEVHGLNSIGFDDFELLASLDETTWVDVSQTGYGPVYMWSVEISHYIGQAYIDYGGDISQWGVSQTVVDNVVNGTSPVYIKVKKVNTTDAGSTNIDYVAMTVDYYLPQAFPCVV